jgi:hypothetical protein
MPINFHPIPNSLKTEPINYSIELIKDIHKKETHPLEIIPCVLETFNTKSQRK